MHSRHIVLIPGIGDSPQQAKNRLGSTQTLLAATRNAIVECRFVLYCQRLLKIFAYLSLHFQ